jgi:hypothetical protein
MRPFFRHHEGAVDETLREIEAATLFQIGRQRLQNMLEDALTYPTLEAPMAGLVRWIPVGQIGPLGTRAQNPEDAIEHLAAAPPRASSSVCTARHLPNQRLYYLPLLVRQVHCCILLEDTAYQSLSENSFRSVQADGA